jgi:hypothetical protein
MISGAMKPSVPPKPFVPDGKVNRLIPIMQKYKMETSDMSVIVRFEVLTVARVKIQVFRDVLLCHWMNGSHSFKDMPRTTHPVTQYHITEHLKQHLSYIGDIYNCMLTVHTIVC